MIKQLFPLDIYDDGTAMAEALAVHLRKVLRRGPDKYHGGFYPETDRKIVVRSATLTVYYGAENMPLQNWVSERVAGFIVGWTVATKGLDWA